MRFGRGGFFDAVGGAVEEDEAVVVCYIGVEDHFGPLRFGRWAFLLGCGVLDLLGPGLGFLCHVFHPGFERAGVWKRVV